MSLTTNGGEFISGDSQSPAAFASEVGDQPVAVVTDKTAAENDERTVEIRAERPNFLTATRFSDFDLPVEIMTGIDAAGFDYCTPIQAQVIPVALEGQDIAGQAQTGTGKTTAFLVPLLSRLLRRAPVTPGLPRAMVITPTRELALQIFNDVKLLSGATGLTITLVMGGLDYREQAEALGAGTDVVICTPGRIIDYLKQGLFTPTAIEVAVVDEADRLLDMGFVKDLKTILSKLPPYTHRQTMLFSATLDDRVLELTYHYMNPPQYITAEPDPLSKIQIDQSLYHVSNDEKFKLLLGLLNSEEHNRVIIFCNTKNQVEWLTKKLVLNGLQAEGITGDLPQAKRLKLMEAFKEKKLQIMVATDLASRGLHVEEVSHVYNYDLPQDAENYIHRIGRTARAGKSGKAISFACEEHVFHLEAIENVLGEKIPVLWADDDLFFADNAGEVKVREKRPHPKSKSGFNAENAPAHPQRGVERRSLPKITRPGGIFGLSPRYPITEGVADPRQTLSWKPIDFIKEVHGGPVKPVKTAAQSFAAKPQTSQGKTEGGRHEEFAPISERDGRRRKRRRGKGPKEHDVDARFQQDDGAPQSVQEIGATSDADAAAQDDFGQAGQSKPLFSPLWPQSDKDYQIQLEKEYGEARQKENAQSAAAAAASGAAETRPAAVGEESGPVSSTAQTMTDQTITAQTITAQTIMAQTTQPPFEEKAPGQDVGFRQGALTEGAEEQKRDIPGQVESPADVELKSDRKEPTYFSEPVYDTRDRQSAPTALDEPGSAPAEAASLAPDDSESRAEGLRDAESKPLSPVEIGEQQAQTATQASTSQATLSSQTETAQPTAILQAPDAGVSDEPAQVEPSASSAETTVARQDGDDEPACQVEQEQAAQREREKDERVRDEAIHDEAIHDEVIHDEAAQGETDQEETVQEPEFPAVEGKERDHQKESDVSAEGRPQPPAEFQPELLVGSDDAFISTQNVLSQKDVSQDVVAQEAASSDVMAPDVIKPDVIASDAAIPDAAIDAPQPPEIPKFQESVFQQRVPSKPQEPSAETPASKPKRSRKPKPVSAESSAQIPSVQVSSDKPSDEAASKQTAASEKIAEQKAPKPKRADKPKPAVKDSSGIDKKDGTPKKKSPVGSVAEKASVEKASKKAPAPSKKAPVAPPKAPKKPAEKNTTQPGTTKKNKTQDKNLNPDSAASQAKTPKSRVAAAGKKLEGEGESKTTPKRSPKKTGGD
ncbi:MAG: DEAD/DEAH box helicase [Deltaproteobacteria bacterium]|jgi:ATP-dependent RNA helicase RhlB|nr:DEAD/DEAH box helicase [Deltaproteobacteria bacterium]